MSHKKAERGRKRTRGGRAGVRALQWGALAALCASVLLWMWFVVQGAGRAAVRALADNPAQAPVEVLAAPRILEVGRPADLDAIERELRSIGYREVSRTPRQPAEYARSAGRMAFYRRAHLGPYGETPDEFVRLTVENGTITAMTLANGRPAGVFVMAPVPLGAFRGPVLEERRPLPLESFPPRLVQAVIAAEDERYFRHRGVDPRAILRALWADLRGGGIRQGGSTITQQVIKNRIVGSERTWLRKAHEALLAAYVEREVTKERLLEIYLNEIYLGQRGAVSVIGAPAAALHYFGRNVDALALNQSALLAGMIASPGRFDPRRDPDAARGRMRWVLGRMAELGFIDRAEADAAGQAALGVAPLEDPLDPAGDVLDAARREVERRGWSPLPGRQRVLVHTSIDVELQAASRRALEETLEQLEREKPPRAPLEGAVAILRPTDGEILALVGGRRGVRGNFHRALDAHRQPGSAFKPFVALAAFAGGEFLPSSIVEDAPLAAPTAQGPWTPQNFDGEFRGPVSVRRALEESLNVPVARLGLAVGPAEIVTVARRVGFAGRLPSTPSLALGAGETTPLELASAYATLAALGVRAAPSVVRGVTVAPAGARVPLTPGPAPTTVAPRAACWMVLDALAGVVERGTGRALAPRLGGVRVAAKTGTTQDGRDAWFALATGEAVVVVYVGRDDDRPASLTGAGAALPVVDRLLAAVGPRLIAPLPAPPDDLEFFEVDPATGGLASARCPERVTEVFPAGQRPKSCPAHGGLLRRFWRKLTGRGAAPAPPAGRTPAPGRR